MSRGNVLYILSIIGILLCSFLWGYQIWVFILNPSVVLVFGLTGLLIEITIIIYTYFGENKLQETTLKRIRFINKSSLILLIIVLGLWQTNKKKTHERISNLTDAQTAYLNNCLSNIIGVWISSDNKNSIKEFKHSLEYIKSGDSLNKVDTLQYYFKFEPYMDKPTSQVADKENRIFLIEENFNNSISQRSEIIKCTFDTLEYYKEGEIFMYKRKNR